MELWVNVAGLIIKFSAHCEPPLSLPSSQDSLSVHAQVTKHLYTFLKFAGLLALVSMFYLSQVFFERIFVTRPWKAGFRSLCHTFLACDWSFENYACYYRDTVLTPDIRLYL